MTKYPVEDRLVWRRWVTPALLKAKPIHRWYTFPHSFTSELVHALIDEWGLTTRDCILDPFVGAGTTVLAAKEKGIPACGYDISPLAVLATQTKVANYNLPHLNHQWQALKSSLRKNLHQRMSCQYPELVRKALPGKLLVSFDFISNQIDSLPCSPSERGFFHLALLSILPQYSHAVAAGGWLKWVGKHRETTSVPLAFENQVEMMIQDLSRMRLPRRAWWQANKADSRDLPGADAIYTAVITSPPYPNRHDYTRVFGVELMFGFLNWDQTRRLRYQSFHSHPEARPKRPASNSYKTPSSLRTAVAQIIKLSKDERVPLILEGYFLDMYLCLCEVHRVCKPKAKVAFVVGNAQYCGKPIYVDQYTAEIGEQVGLRCTGIITARYRGNSAQQMKEFGIKPSRESVVIFEKR